jgi:predicted nucleic acid-binding protein
MDEPDVVLADQRRHPLRVMADANVLIAGIFFPQWFHEFLRHALQGDFKLALSDQTIREARERMAQGTPT